ncbi:cupredoxin domain-containing protein [Mesorhizobium sp.]|uniref:cupredoxin domain-containing protein n=1 Tax=Mesorhizobium sp. TaxID=1871066 RepID=UPI000FE8C187|nr:cupredoxin domain-containing protein [Mesorhizobium sp.]RWM39471.1 MAG: cupredoxin domain-containing protein [Mesorhizobium sp.]TJV52526.1 MAG: cupredoxin domain-containing protein [Mesorhizobium sp.]
MDSASIGLAAIVVGACILATVAVADESPTFVVDLKDGVVTPQSLEVPANSQFRLELRNSGSSPAEFESIELRKEKVLGPGASSFVVIRRLDPGEYRFFDDFHPGMPPATLVAKELAAR